jgi:hypothetical protein
MGGRSFLRSNLILDLMKVRAGSAMVLPFLFISIHNLLFGLLSMVEDS